MTPRLLLQVLGEGADGPSVSCKLCVGAPIAAGRPVERHCPSGAASRKALYQPLTEGKGISWRSFPLNKSLAVGVNAARGEEGTERMWLALWFGLGRAGSGSCSFRYVQIDRHQ